MLSGRRVPLIGPNLVMCGLGEECGSFEKQHPSWVKPNAICFKLVQIDRWVCQVGECQVVAKSIVVVALLHRPVWGLSDDILADDEESIGKPGVFLWGFHASAQN